MNYRDGRLALTIRRQRVEEQLAAAIEAIEALSEDYDLLSSHAQASRDSFIIQHKEEAARLDEELAAIDAEAATLQAAGRFAR